MTLCSFTLPVVWIVQLLTPIKRFLIIIIFENGKIVFLQFQSLLTSVSTILLLLLLWKLKTWMYWYIAYRDILFSIIDIGSQKSKSTSVCSDKMRNLESVLSLSCIIASACFNSSLITDHLPACWSSGWTHSTVSPCTAAWLQRGETCNISGPCSLSPTVGKWASPAPAHNASSPRRWPSPVPGSPLSPSVSVLGGAWQPGSGLQRTVSGPADDRLLHVHTTASAPSESRSEKTATTPFLNTESFPGPWFNLFFTF